MNWGKAFAWLGVIQSLGAAVGFAFMKDWRRALYFFFAAAITATQAW